MLKCELHDFKPTIYEYEGKILECCVWCCRQRLVEKEVSLGKK